MPVLLALASAIVFLVLVGGADYPWKALGSMRMIASAALSRVPTSAEDATCAAAACAPYTVRCPRHGDKCWYHEAVCDCPDVAAVVVNLPRPPRKVRRSALFNAQLKWLPTSAGDE